MSQQVELFVYLKKEHRLGVLSYENKYYWLPSSGWIT